MIRHLGVWAFLASCIIAPIIALSEPWTANRYAQNCAGCHAPGRFNVKPVDRRCTLNCQGCHTNPNGGGLRNEYGVWVQERWLRSFRSSKLMGNKKLPARHEDQPYMGYEPTANEARKKIKNKLVKKDPKSGKKVAVRPKAPGALKKYVVRWKRYKDGELPQMTEIDDLFVDESIYDKHSYKDWRIDAKSEAQFLSRVPEDDPWRLEREKMILAGGDLRVFFTSLTEDLGASQQEKEGSGVMATDVGVRIRPIPQYLQMVFEARAQNNIFIPRNRDLFEGFSGAAFLRSAYLLSDNLPFNSWFMAGLYRPGFGHMNADHTALSQTQAAAGYTPYKLISQAVGFGTAPNVPFLDAHLILPVSSNSVSSTSLRDEGYNVNFGGRFVTLSASGKLSYWQTKNVDSQIERRLISATLGGMYRRLIANYEILSSELAFPVGAAAAGGTCQGPGNCKALGYTNTLELKYRFWREMYGQVNIAYSNVARKTLAPGSAADFMAGVKSFLYPNMELEALYIAKTDSSGSMKTETNGFQLQFHYFF